MYNDYELLLWILSISPGVEEGKGGLGSSRFRSGGKLQFTNCPPALLTKGRTDCMCPRRPPAISSDEERKVVSLPSLSPPTSGANDVCFSSQVMQLSCVWVVRMQKDMFLSMLHQEIMT